MMTIIVRRWDGKREEVEVREREARQVFQVMVVYANPDTVQRIELEDKHGSIVQSVTI